MFLGKKYYNFCQLAKKFVMFLFKIIFYFVTLIREPGSGIDKKKIRSLFRMIAVINHKQIT